MNLRTIWAYAKDLGWVLLLLLGWWLFILAMIYAGVRVL